MMRTPIRFHEIRPGQKVSGEWQLRDRHYSMVFVVAKIGTAKNGDPWILAEGDEAALENHEDWHGIDRQWFLLNALPEETSRVETLPMETLPEMPANPEDSNTAVDPDDLREFLLTLRPTAEEETNLVSLKEMLESDLFDGVRMRFWDCPVPEHARNDERDVDGRRTLTETVIWDGDIASCTFEGCNRTSATTPPRDAPEPEPVDPARVSNALDEAADEIWAHRFDRQNVQDGPDDFYAGIVFAVHHLRKRAKTNPLPQQTVPQQPVPEQPAAALEPGIPEEDQ